MVAARFKIVCSLFCLSSIFVAGSVERASFAQEVWGQGGWGQEAWGDRSFDTSSDSNADRRWNGNGFLGSTGSAPRWQLGVSTDNTDAGVVVRQVSPNSAAARAGIFTGDVIVCVAGDQVGRVGNQIYDLGEELRQHADSRGSVLLLVLDRRSGQLRPLTVQLENQRAGLNGTLAIRGGRLPNDAVVTVRLENESRPSYQVHNGESSFRVSNFGVGEIPFELRYDPRYISSGDTYMLRAFVTSAGRTIYSTLQPTYVLTKGNPSRVRLVLDSPTQYPGGGNFIQAGYAPPNDYQREVAAIYERILRRMPSNMEIAAFYRTPNVAAAVQRLPLDLMATQEYFIRSGGDNLTWTRQVFNEIVGHAPTSTEIDRWMRRFGELRYSRTELLNQLNMQARG